MEFDGKSVVVVGAGHGIGRATAILFAKLGARLTLGDIDPGMLGETTGEVVTIGAEVSQETFDLRSSQSVESLMRRAEERFGRIDVLANVAGIYPKATVLDTSDDLWANVIGVNLTGVFYCCRAVMPRMLASGGGSIVNVSSGAAEIPYVGLSAYSASKGGIQSLSRVLAKEGAPSIRVNTVAPGPTLTRRTSGDVDDESGPFKSARKVTEGIPLGRWADPEEIAQAIAYIASDRASFVTGQVLRVNGGNHMS